MARTLNDLTGQEVLDGIDGSHGGTSLTGGGIDFYRLLLIRQALQVQAMGMKLSGKLPRGTTMARKMLGFKGNRESLLEQVEELISRIQAEADLARLQQAQEAPNPLTTE